LIQTPWDRRARGYTMLELMVVCGIISILAAMSFALMSRVRSQSVETNALSALNVLATGFEMYRYENRSYPHWGPGQRFSSPDRIVDDLIKEEFIPRSYKKYVYDPETRYIFGITQDYAIEIPAYNPADPTTSVANSFFIVFHPYNFQRDALAIGNSPPSGWVAVRARRGREGDNYRTFDLFVFHRVEAE